MGRKSVAVLPQTQATVSYTHLDVYKRQVVKRCPKCDWRIFDKVTPTSSIIELKCPNCRKIVEIQSSTN